MAPGQEPEVIVSGLPFNATDNDIKNHFKNCKNVVNVKIMMGQDGRPRGKAFVKFSSVDAMTKAIALNESQMNGWVIYVEQTRPREQQISKTNDRFGGSSQNANGVESTNIIVRNLSFNVDEERLRSCFSGCGNIKGVRIMKNEENRSKGFGFVDFFNVESARNAVSKSGEKFDGREMNIEYSLPRGPGGYQGKPQKGGFGGNSGFGGNRNNFNNSNERKGYMTNFTGEQVDL